MLLPLLLVLAVTPEEPAAYPSLASDAGFAVDAGEHGEVIDSTSADAGSREVSVTPRVAIHIGGAKVLPPEVYLDLITLPARARPDAATALVVQKQVLEFLLRTGFELATVAARAADGAITVEIDEGQIERVIFVGQLTFQQVRFKLALLLPNDVFNRPLLDRQVRQLSEEMHLPGVIWELVRTSEVIHSGPQVEQLPGPMDLALQGDRIIHARRPYEVRVVFPEQTATGLGIDLRSSFTDGLEAGLNYRAHSLIFDGDRGFVAASGGAGARARLDTDKLYAHFSRTALELRYDLFPLGGYVRPNVWAQGEWLARQRPDLQLENYNAVSAAAALQFELELRRGVHFLTGVGFEWRRLFGFEGTPGVPLSPDVVLAERKRPFFRVTHESVFDPSVLRWERRHTVESELRVYFPLADQPAVAWVDVRYQYVRAFGWHDLWVKSHGHLAWGDVSFHDEVSLGEYVRSLFGGQFVPAAVNLQLEFRFSVVRDIFKVSIFHDLALFAVRPVRGEPKLLAQLANGFGPGLHFLAQDMFQIDMYVAFGFRRLGVFGVGFALQLQKTF